MDSILNTDFIYDSTPKQNGIIDSFKDKLDIVTILVLIIIVFAAIIINYVPGNFSFIKILKNKCVKCILIGMLLMYAYFYWNINKISVIVLTIVLSCLFYVVNDDVENVEHFTDFYYSKINDNNMDTTPVYTLNSQKPYNTVGCTHIEPNGECGINSEHEVEMADGSPQMDELDAFNGGIVGADINSDGNDLELQQKMLGFGSRYNTIEPKLMVPLNGNSFLKENDARKTLINNRGKIEKIFDARDFSIQTNNGVKKSESYKSNNLICDGTICRRPDVMGGGF